ncbi:hypothetical protein D3C87_1836070 [compost metagenome]
MFDFLSETRARPPLGLTRGQRRAAAFTLKAVKPPLMGVRRHRGEVAGVRIAVKSRRSAENGKGAS